jgi:hypothetical protein
LLRLALFFLEIPADEDVEELVRAADLDIRTDFHRVPALHDRVLQLVKPDFLASIEPGAEVFALEHLLKSDAGVKLEDLLVGHFPEPVAVVNDLGF